MADGKVAEEVEVVDIADLFQTPDDVLAYYQMRLRVPKDQRNEFGKYNYRNMEGINDAFKRIQSELWEKYGILTSLCFPIDDLERSGDGTLMRRVVAELHTPYGVVGTHMRVREPEKQGGMNPSQISGSSSSYAKKYAASDLFAIGGEADPDELPPAVENRYPDDTFDAKCRRCGQVATGLDADTATSWPCPSCGAVDWEPV